MDGSVTNIIGLRTLDINCPTLTPGATYFIRAKLRTNKEFVANVQNTYSGDSSVFVASNSLPHYDIDPQKRVRSFTVTGDTITVPDHNYISGEIVIFTGSAVGLNTDQPYYVKRLNGNQFKLALSAENALGIKSSQSTVLGLCRPILLRPSITRHRKYRNMNRFSFDYAFRPRLRSRLTLGGLTWPRNPWTFGVRVSRPHFRYSCQHPHFPALHHGSHHSFSARGTLPYHRPEGRSAASAHGLSPVIFSVQARLTSELLRFL